MGKALALDREIIFTDAALAVAAARQSGAQLNPVSEASRIVKSFPGSGVTEDEIVATIRRLLGAIEPVAARIVSGGHGSDDAAGDAGHFPSQGTDPAG